MAGRLIQHLQVLILILIMLHMKWVINLEEITHGLLTEMKVQMPKWSQEVVQQLWVMLVLQVLQMYSLIVTLIFMLLQFSKLQIMLKVQVAKQILVQEMLCQQ